MDLVFREEERARAAQPPRYQQQKACERGHGLHTKQAILEDSSLS